MRAHHPNIMSLQKGIHSREVRVSDDIVWISGVLQPLVVRDRRQEERSVEIMSPVDMVSGRKRYYFDVGGKMRYFPPLRRTRKSENSRNSVSCIRSTR
jgi:hypothetical protein